MNDILESMLEMDNLELLGLLKFVSNCSKETVDPNNIYTESEFSQKKIKTTKIIRNEIKKRNKV